MGLKFSGCAINYEALVPRRNEPSVLFIGAMQIIRCGLAKPFISIHIDPRSR